MEDFKLVSLLLLIPVIVDAVGDAFRLDNRQILHHVMEVIHIACWVALWAAFGFDPMYIAMYILGRIVLFDITFNLTSGLKIGYVGGSSIYDLLLRVFGGWVKQHPANFAFITRVMALVFWVGLFIKG